MTFDQAVLFVLENEGGVSYDVNDSGGLTKWGISSAQYPEVKETSFSRENAIAIYKRDYWDRCRCDNFPWEIALLVFDTAVNHGPGYAVRALQMGLNITADGIVGAVTIRGAWSATLEQAMDILARRATAYADNKAFWHFGRGWMRRLFRLHNEIAKGLAA